MRVLVTGGRVFQDRDWLWAGLDLLHSYAPGISEIIEGGAPGADVRAQEWARHRGVRCTTMHADWDKHGRSAGFIRNIEMARLMPAIVLACPGGKGTAHMVETARAHNLKVVFLERMPVVKGVLR